MSSLKPPVPDGGKKLCPSCFQKVEEEAGIATEDPDVQYRYTRLDIS